MIHIASSLYLELTNEELTKIVKSALNTEVLAYRRLTGGMFNTTYFVNTGIGATVLRVGPVNRHLLMHFEHNLMNAEARVYDLCHKNNIPVSEVLAVDTTKTVVDRDFMIVKYIESKPMSEADLKEEDKNRICYDIGQAAANFHKISSPAFGRVAGESFSKWSDCITDELEKWEIAAKTTSLFTKEQYAQIKDVFFKAVPYLDEIKTASLTHTDLWTGNILITTAEKPQFAAIIDADRAIWGDPMMDFSSIQWTYNEPKFWEGYGKTLSDKHNDVVRRKIYTLLVSLFDAYVWEREYNEPNYAKSTVESVLKLIAELNNLIALI